MTTQKNYSENEIEPLSGWLGVAGLLAAGASAAALAASLVGHPGAPDIVSALTLAALVLAFAFLWASFLVVQPQEAVALTFLGSYRGTVRTNGFFCIFPFYAKIRLSLKIVSVETAKIKVNDLRGNPIEIGGIFVYHVQDTAKAAFGVDNYHEFIRTQSESALRQLAHQFAYDHGSSAEEKTLLKNTEEVNATLEREIRERVADAGVTIKEARISHLAYSPEIAQAMLRRQQAEAVIAARKTIVDGAVQIVSQAVCALEGATPFSPEEKCRLVSNLLVVLCSENSVHPVLSTDQV